jgi:WD40 repeat protein
MTVTLPEDVAYACLFWVKHICLVKTDIVQSVMEVLDKFVHRYLLHWFEAMSLLGRSKDTSTLLDDLSDWITVSFPLIYFIITEMNFLQQANSSGPSNLIDLVRDGSRFTRTFGTSIKEHPLLVYFGALPFAPINSAIYKQFCDAQLFPTISGGYQQSWSPLLLVLTGHSHCVYSVAYSPDGKHIVSGSHDKTVRVWNGSSGFEIFPALRGHEDAVLSVAFSPDGKRIISGSRDKTVRVWDAKSGVEILLCLQGHEGAVCSVAISPDGTRFISGSADKTVRIWDAQLGVEILPALHGHGHVVMAVAFSPDGTQIVSGSGDGLRGMHHWAWKCCQH